MEFIILAFILFGFIGLAIYLKKPESGPEAQLEEKDAKILVLEKELSERNTTITNLNKQLEIAAARAEDFDQIKLEKAAINERLSLIDRERNTLKNENIAFQKAEEGRQKEGRREGRKRSPCQGRPFRPEQAQSGSASGCGVW